jgi:hypothetical protein
MGEAQCGVGEHKKGCRVERGGGEREYTVASQKYTPVPRARGVTKVYLFFFRLIGC